MVDVDALRGTCFGSCERIGDEAPASGLAFGLNLRSEGRDSRNRQSSIIINMTHHSSQVSADLIWEVARMCTL
jgi:hypothetical protein